MSLLNLTQFANWILEACGFISSYEIYQTSMIDDTRISEYEDIAINIDAKFAILLS